jgi:hypothetical protein
MNSKKIRIYPKLELAQLWANDCTKFAPDAVSPPLCPRCGRPLNERLSLNAWSRYADIYICNNCGMDEAMQDYRGAPLPLSEWAAVKADRLKEVPDDDSWILTPECTFSQVFQNTVKAPNSCMNRPASELAYSRSDYDGYRWWTRWFTCQEEHKTPELAREIDQFTEALFHLPEFQTLDTLRRMCLVYAQSTSEPTEFNLYSETDRFYIWLRAITREKDYNLYVHYYLKDC